MRIFMDKKLLKYCHNCVTGNLYNKHFLNWWPRPAKMGFVLF